MAIPAKASIQHDDKKSWRHKIESKPGIGSRIITRLKYIRQWTGLDMQEVFRIVEDKHRFANVIAIMKSTLKKNLRDFGIKFLCKNKV